MGNGDIVRIYSAVLRPVIEYACQIYGPMLTKTQNKKIERLQRIILKIVYGFDTSYREALALSGLQRLSERRDEIIKKLALRTFENPRYKHWFPLQEVQPHDFKKRNKFMEERSNTERRMRGPIFPLRRILNNEL